MNSWIFATADDEDLHDILSSKIHPVGYPWPSATKLKPLPKEVGVLVAENPRSAPPACVVVSPEASRRLFGRYSQLRSDLSPLSAWTHVLDWSQFEQLRDEAVTPELGALEAAWTGLAIAEALILSDRPLAQLKLAACLATSTYAVARTCALWPSESVSNVLERYDLCQGLIRSGKTSGRKLREALKDIWEVLAALSKPLPSHASPETRILGECVVLLLRARENGWNEWHALSSRLDLPQSNRLQMLETMPAELRVREFDSVIKDIEATAVTDRHMLNQLYFLAGYLATVAAGGAPSLSLAERLASRYPQITAWAYVLGSVGERVTWASGFDGLGRLVARELQRPFRIDEGPLCDFAFAEANVLVDRGLQDPLVHLRVKQARVVTVGLFPGVNVTVPLAEPLNESRSRPPIEAPRPYASDPMRILARALAPYLIDEIAGARSASSASSRRGGRNIKGSEQRLPLDRDDE